MKRTFIALPVSSEIDGALIGIQNKIKELYPDAPIKWTESGNFHMTLEFLGDIEEDQISQVQEILQMITSNYPSIPYELDRVFGFPSLHRPKVLVVKAFDRDKTGFQLRQDIHKQLKDLGLADNGRPWKPHLTLGRLKGALRMDELSKIDVANKHWTADRVIFYESQLSQKGPVYKPITKYSLDR